MSVHNPRFPHTVVISRAGEFDQFDDSSSPEYTIVYSGKCRNYQQEYVKTSGEVAQSVRCLAIPVPYGSWETIPLENDIVEVNMDSHVEKGRVIDKQPNNFGTDIYWMYERN